MFSLGELVLGILFVFFIGGIYGFSFSEMVARILFLLFVVAFVGSIIMYGWIALAVAFASMVVLLLPLSCLGFFSK